LTDGSLEGDAVLQTVVDLWLDAWDWEELLLLQQAEGHWDWAAMPPDSHAANLTLEGEALLQPVDVRLDTRQEVLLLQQAEGQRLDARAANEFYVVCCHVS
jgi:hypothetical protein